MSINFFDFQALQKEICKDIFKECIGSVQEKEKKPKPARKPKKTGTSTIVSAIDTKYSQNKVSKDLRFSPIFNIKRQNVETVIEKIKEMKKKSLEAEHEDVYKTPIKILKSAKQNPE